MLQSLLKKKLKSNQEMREFAEKDGEFYTSVFQQVAESDLKKEIERLLYQKENGWLSKIEYLLQKEENRNMKNLEEELWIAEQLCFISKEEKAAGRLSLLYQCNSLKQVQEIYHLTIFYITRIELDMEKEFCIGLLAFIKKWKLSPEYLVMVLEKGKFYNRAYVGGRLVNLLQENGEEKYAEQILERIVKLWEKHHE